MPSSVPASTTPTLFYMAPLRKTSLLQKTKNLHARVVTCSPRFFHSSSDNLLQHLHWLPIKHRINFKIANITFRTLHLSQPVSLTYSSFYSFSGSQAPICSPLHSFVLHLTPKIWTLSLRLFECVPVMILSVINSRSTTSSRPSNPLSVSFWHG